MTGCGTTKTNTNTAPVANTNTAVEENTNAVTNENTNTDNTVTEQDVVATGMVYLKGYNTPSESYGITTASGNEIGLGKYDTMKEQFRAYIGERITVTFSNVCKTSNQDCCRTLFPYCGTVKDWVPVEDTNTNSTE